MAKVSGWAFKPGQAGWGTHEAIPKRWRAR